MDVLLLVGNVAYHASNDPGEPVTRFGDPRWRGDLDGSYAEIVGHAQIVVAVVVLLVVAVVRRTLVHAAWALAFAGLFLDDFLQVHERLGAALAAGWGLPAIAGLRSTDLGELLVWAGEALALGLVVVVATVRSEARDRRDSLVLFGCTVVIAVFGVAIDQVHSVLEPHVAHVVAVALTLTETAGELLGMSLALFAAAAMVAVTAPRRAPEPTVLGGS
ncbi:hypothetical protein [Frigoribacterium salinisoli]